eukprot:3275025-Prorocentrum_lima.AAC.1
MADATLADKLHQSLSPQDPMAPLPVASAVSSLDPITALQQHLESCHATLNVALRQNMEAAQQRIQQVVQQALLSAL